MKIAFPHSSEWLHPIETDLISYNHNLYHECDYDTSVYVVMELTEKEFISLSMVSGIPSKMERFKFYTEDLYLYHYDRFAPREVERNVWDNFLNGLYCICNHPNFVILFFSADEVLEEDLSAHRHIIHKQ